MTRNTDYLESQLPPRQAGDAFEKMYSVPDPPCDVCEHEDRCYYQKLACNLFARYCDICNKRARMDRKPSREIYDKIFNRDAE